MNIAKYLRGEHQHIGTSRVTPVKKEVKLQSPNDLMDKANTETLTWAKREIAALRQQLEEANSYYAGALLALRELKEVVPPKDWKQYAEAVLEASENRRIDAIAAGRKA